MKTYSRRLILYSVLIVIIIGILCLGVLKLLTQRFNSSVFDSAEANNTIVELSSDKYQGRLAGSEGNKQALQYVENYFKQIGVDPAGEQGGYYQQLKSMVPVYTSEPYFGIKDQSGKSLAEYVLGSDYCEVLSGYGSGGNYTGELFVPTKNITGYSEQELMGKVVLVPGVRDEEIAYAIDHGVKGLITSANIVKRSPVPIESKKGKSLLLLTLRQDKFSALKQLAVQPVQAVIHLNIAYKMLDTPNILGKITGRKQDEYIIISSQIDGLGSTGNGNYFPSTLDGASGVGMMLELAKTMKSQKILPEKTVIFAAWNNQEFGYKGSSYYAAHPLFPLAKSSLVMLNGIGGKDSKEIVVSSSGQLGLTYADLITQYAADSKQTARLNSGAPELESFVNQNVPSVLVTNTLGDNYGSQIYNLRSIMDSPSYLSNSVLQGVGTALLNYTRIEIYGDYFPEYLTKANLILLMGYFLGLALIYIIVRIYKFNPQLLLLKRSVEEVYFSWPFNLTSKVFAFITPVLLIFLSLIFICSFPLNFNLVNVGNRHMSNFSWYLVIKQAVAFIQQLFSSGLGTSKYHLNVMDALSRAFVKSLLLLFLAVCLAFGIGIVKGIRDGYRSKQVKILGTLGTIAGLSMPDVLVVMLVQLILIYMVQHNLSFLTGRTELIVQFYIPLICLTVLPAVYISRIVATVVQEETNKDYIRVAKAKGLSQLRIVLSHLLPVTVIRVVESLSSVLTMMISNLIIIEYLCNYPGIVYGLMYYYKQRDTVPFIGFALALGLLYLSFTLLFRGLARLINPLKREGMY